MTNGEFYKKRLKELTDGGCGIAIVDNMPEVCFPWKCDKCSRYNFSNDSCSDLKLIEWYNLEHTPIESTIEITKKQKEFLEFLPKNGSLVRHGYNNLHYKNNLISYDNIDLGQIEILIEPFDFVKHNKEILVKDILKNAKVVE